MALSAYHIQTVESHWGFLIGDFSSIKCHIRKFEGDSNRLKSFEQITGSIGIIYDVRIII